MQNYINQLLDDIHRASWKIKPPHHLWEESGANPDDELEQEDMSYVEKYIYGEKEPISEIIGIETEMLPPADKLSDQERALLAVELEKLLQLFHFYLDFPESFPAHLRYSFIRDFWSTEEVPLSFGENHIEFCQYEEEDCPFPGYCDNCMINREQMKYDEKHGVMADFDFEPHELLPDINALEANLDDGDDIGGNRNTGLLYDGNEFNLN